MEKAIKLSNEKAKGQTGDDLPFEPSGEHQYRIFYDALTWEEAKAACEAKGGHLATITSEEEQQKLNTHLTSEAISTAILLSCLDMLPPTLASVIQSL